MRKFWSTLPLLIIATTLAACGGSDDKAFVTPGGVSSAPGGTGTTGTGTTTTVTASALTVTSSAATIPSDGSATATITALARNDDNNLIAGVSVCFQASSGGIAGTTNGCVTTDANGAAAVTLSTAGDSSLRTITVTATAGSEVATTTVQVVAAGSSSTTTVQMGNGTGTSFVAGAIGVGIGTAELPAGGTTGLTVSLVDQATNTLYDAAPVTVTFNSPCVANGQATITATADSGGTTVAAGTATTSTGIVNATYAAAGCSGADPITATATVGSQNLAATGTVTVAATSVGSIQFVSASETSIGLKGTGLNETSTLVFKVLNSTGGPYSGVTVNFALNTTVGGLALSPTTAVSGSDGTVQTTISSGTQHTTVRVTASITTPVALSTQSSQLTVSTGLPTSNGFSIAVGRAGYPPTTTSPLACPNVEADTIDGVTVPVSVILSDRYGNPVPDGTAVAFTTNGGQITGSCNTTGGTCSVTWTSSNPRPSTTSTPPSNGSGRVTILATTIGEESFDDVNGNGFYDSGEPFSDLGEPYRDDNQNGQYDLGEYFIDFNHNGVRDGPSGQFVGITCTADPTTGAITSCTQNTLAIGVSNLITMSTSNAVITANETSSSSNITFGGSPAAPSITAISGSGLLVLNVKDANGNSMAAGTTVTATSSSSTIVGVTPAGATTVGCDATQGGQNYSFTLTPGGSGTATVTIEVQSPSSTATYLNIQVTP